MSATDDIKILSAGQGCNAPSPNGRAPHGVLTPPATRRENGRPVGHMATPPRFLTALLRALSVWPA
jgi:hypothetical protein